MRVQRAGSQFEWDLGMAVLSEYDADGFLGIGFDHYGEQKAGVAPGELHSPYGFLSRQLDPDTDASGNPSRGCNLWLIYEGSELHTILGSDPRVTPNLPALKKGEAMLYGSAANFVRCHADGSLTLFCTADGTNTGQTVYSKITPSGFLSFAPWGKETFDANGYHLFTGSGARLDLGGIGGLPAPLNALGAYARLSAPVVQIMGSTISLGPSNGAADSVAKAGALQVALASVSSALGAVSTALSDMSNAIAVSGKAPIVDGKVAVSLPAAVAALNAAVSAIATAATTVPSQSVTVV